jgi:hypothetical protein
MRRNQRVSGSKKRSLHLAVPGDLREFLVMNAQRHEVSVSAFVVGLLRYASRPGITGLALEEEVLPVVGKVAPGQRVLPNLLYAVTGRQS